MSIIDKIKAHGEKISSKNVTSKAKTCPKCNESPSSYSLYFHLHQAKPRLFYVVFNCAVHSVWSCLGLWKCPLCGKTFIEYPDFAVPYKRYTKENILKVSQIYVEEEKASYRGVVEENGGIYEDDINKDQPRDLSHTTLWRWLSFLSSLISQISNALDIIKQKSPTSDIFRKFFSIPPHKYRSELRKIVLQQCLKLFKTEVEFVRIFNHSIFHHFATIADWR